MKDLRLFATDAYPLHPSGMRTLLTCPWRVALHYLTDPESEGGAAGDTGSATHVAVSEMHRGKSLDMCLQSMRERNAEYPLADLADAADLFLKYSADSRNVNADVVFVEKPIAFSIKPAADDPTQAPIQVVGRLDQVRLVDGKHKLFDLKTSKKDPFNLLQKYVFQMAAYCVGASYLLNTPVQPGAIILPRRYGSRDPSTAPVYWHFAWTLADTDAILEGVRHAVSRVRQGILFHVPNDDCGWCHAKSPDLCLPKLQETLKLQTSSSLE